MGAEMAPDRSVTPGPSLAGPRYPVAIIGGGPAGLTAAYELTRRGILPIVLEKGKHVGGLARTESYRGYHFDVGGHRFYTKVDAIQQLWEELLGADLLRVQRLSRIFYRGRFFHYPIQLQDALRNLGVSESFLMLCSYLHSQVRPYPVEDTFEQWVSNRFGHRLYRAFFKTYTEKVWGLPCDQIHATWAAQRIKGLSLTAALMHALFPTNNIKSLVHEFHYPRLGPGMMWERFRQVIERQGAPVRLGAEVVQLSVSGNRVTGLLTRQGEEMIHVDADQFVSSMPLAELVLRLSPPAPDHVLSAARQLRYRAFILVGLILERERTFPDNWIYVHSPDVRMGRIQNFKNWSAAMVAEPQRTSLGAEFFCDEGDALWSMSDVALIAQAIRELSLLGLADARDVVDGMVIREPKAYPVYDPDYAKHVAVIVEFLKTLRNLQVLGRNGMHRYNNQDHSMLTALYAARNLMGEKHDLWSINADSAYYEEFVDVVEDPDA